MKKVLVIEDSADVRSLISDMLAMNGYEVFAAGDGLEGIDAAETHGPDLIICDLRMPELDGFGTLARLRKSERTAAIPFVFLTGASDKPLMRQGMELGADDYLTKPFSLTELLAAVRARLEKKAVFTQLAERKLDELRGSISMALPHELLTPLTGILGFASILLEDHGLMGPEEIADAARSIQESALRLRRTIENFLLYTQIELVTADPVRLAAVRGARHDYGVEDLLAAPTETARQAGRLDDLRTKIEPAVLPMPPDRLGKLVQELLGNAIKFSPPGTEIRFQAVASNAKFVISVTDHGRGMSAEQIASIGAHMQFERKFYEQQGSGLGLILARRLAELHGGSLHLESTPGERTSVKVTLPRLD